jgi:tRNA dimethylallyltransferase
MDTDGPEALRQEVLERAPRARIAEGDRNRIVRYLELLEMGVDPDPGTDELWSDQMRHPTLLAGLVMDRDELDQRIDARMEAIAAVALEEVRAAHAAGASPTARKAHGFEALLSGDVEGMKLRARQLARRQLTWMRKLSGVQIVDATGRGARAVAEEILTLVPPRA